MNTYPNLYYLQYLVDAVELGSITASARKNRVSHSAVSRAISALESQMGLVLLDHQKKSFNVTEVGLRTAEQARILLKSADHFRSSELEESADVVGTISLGFSRSLADNWLPPLIKELRSRFPSIRAQVKFGITNELTEAVAKGDLDLALTIGTQSLSTLQSKVVRKGQFVLFEKNKSHFKRDPLTKRSFILTEPKLETELLKKRYFEHYGSELSLSCEVSSWTGIVNLVKHDIGIGLVPDFVIRSFKLSEFHLIKPQWFDCDYNVYVHASKASSHKKTVAHAVHFIRQLQDGTVI